MTDADEAATAVERGAPTGGGGSDEPPDMGDLYDELEALAATVDAPEERERVAAAMRTAAAVESPGVFGRVVKGFGRGDLAEVLLGSTLFGIPMLVEGGTTEVGAYMTTHPLYVAGTLAFTVAVVVGLLYVSDIQDVRVTHAYFGVVPRRLVGVLGGSFLFAVAAMTAWGRVSWAEPELALASVAIAWVPMAIGAALGDILPGT